MSVSLHLQWWEGEAQERTRNDEAEEKTGTERGMEETALCFVMTVSSRIMSRHR